MLVELLFSLMIQKTPPPTKPYIYTAHQPVVFATYDDWPTEREINCLAVNIYHEARNQGEEGMMAVANVTINRAEDRRFPNDICAVVYESNSKGCQFSWTCAERKYGIHNKKMYEKTREIAWRALTNQFRDNTNGSLFYHAHYVMPAWAKKFTLVAIIGDHLFYQL